LETRLERLRGLYEQYFLGLEKIEPQVARKDVDRRIDVLRREKIRNTARRFKLQTIVQRYNTFQQYWQRICREIENGTYKRHLLRAQNHGQLLTIAARKRLGRAGRISEAPKQVPASQPPSAPAPTAASPPEPITAPTAPVPFAAVPAAPTPATAAAPAAPRPAPAKPAAQKFESLDLDMDFMSDWDPSERRTGVAPVKPAAPAKPPPVQAAPKPAAAAPPPAPPATAPARASSIAPAPVLLPPRPASSRPPQAPARPLGSPRIPPSPRLPPPKPAAPAAAVAPKPAAASAPLKPAAPAPAPTTAAAAAGADDTRLRDLHARLQQAKQQTKEANVSFEGLAKSIRATEAKLREQHKNRTIEFDVVIKDGKAVVKPIIR
ncbi:MAG TPA: MXAN_5187 C-terminal domain-containing protein, partial [Polyangiaceae bacterium]|nr:MXAN_5187 C-terminal domain-containing protein [Polyangiaceae bacterium]